MVPSMTLVAPRPQQERDDGPLPPRLGRRECELLRMWAEGSTDQEAAERLGLSLRTVGRVAASVMERMGARSRFQAGWLAFRYGWFG